MKKLAIISAIILGLGTTSCDSYLDINQDPNSPAEKDVTSSMLLPLLFMGKHNIPAAAYPFVFQGFMVALSILFVVDIRVKKFSTKGIVIMFTIGALIVLGYLKFGPKG